MALTANPNTAAMMQTIVSGYAGLGRGLEQFADKMEARQEEEKNRARQFKSLVEYADASGLMNKDQAVTMSLDELQGRIKGAVVKNELDNFAFAVQQRAAYPKFLAAVSQRTAPAVLGNYDWTRPGPVPASDLQERAPALSDFTSAASESGYQIPIQELAKLGNMATRMQPKPAVALPLGKVMNLGDGVRLIGTGGAPHVIHDTQAQDVPPEGRMMQVGDYRVPIIKQGRNQTSVAWQLATDKNGTLIKDPSVLTTNQRVIGLDKEISNIIKQGIFATPEQQQRLKVLSAQKDALLYGDVSADGGGQGGAPEPMPASKAELRKGTRYTTPRGVATWDGEKFVTGK
jgi:hypothetical protein